MDAAEIGRFPKTAFLVTNPVDTAHGRLNECIGLKSSIERARVHSSRGSTRISAEPAGSRRRTHRLEEGAIMGNRDEFSEPTKRAVAARAGWHCSFLGCPKTTIGPSEEAPDAIAMTGKAAHISAAASGPGARRYLPTMTQEQRKHIDNAIWLCADHADLIDKDEVTFTIEELKEMKRAHEANQAMLHRTCAARYLGAGLLGIGPEIVCMGDVYNLSATSWTLRLKHYVRGDIHQLASYINGFANVSQENRYVLSNEFGDGRVLTAAPSLTKKDGVHTLDCPIGHAFSRINVNRIGSAIAIHPDTNYMYLDEKGGIARVSGIDYLPQLIRSCLSIQRNESVFNPDYGMRFFEYFEEFKGSQWLSLLMKLDVVRMAAIPYSDKVLNRQQTPLLCVSRVRNFELLSEGVKDHRLPVRLDLDIEGLGEWKHETTVYLPTKGQMAQYTKMLGERNLQ